MNKRTITLMAVAAAGVLALSACSSGTGSTTPTSGAAAKGGTEVKGLTGVIGAKDFSEQYILAYLTSDLLNAHGATTTANIKVVGSANVRAALESDNFMGYWEYTGTSWITYNKNTAPVKGEAAQFDATKAADAKNGIAWLDPAPLNNTYAFAIRSDKAKSLGVTSLSDIAKLPVKEQTFCIESEFSTRDDGWPGLKKAYGITVPDSNVKLLDTGVIYQEGHDLQLRRGLPDRWPDQGARPHRHERQQGVLPRLPGCPHGEAVDARQVPGHCQGDCTDGREAHHSRNADAQREG